MLLKTVAHPASTLTKACNFNLKRSCPLEFFPSVRNGWNFIEEKFQLNTSFVTNHACQLLSGWHLKTCFFRFPLSLPAYKQPTNGQMNLGLIPHSYRRWLANEVRYLYCWEHLLHLYEAKTQKSISKLGARFQEFLIVAVDFPQRVRTNP